VRSISSGLRDLLRRKMRTRVVKKEMEKEMKTRTEREKKEKSRKSKKKRKKRKRSPLTSGAPSSQ